MGSDEAKLEKKRLKAQVKAEKARVRSGQLPDTVPISERAPWYRDPNWVRAIVAIVSLFVMIITLVFTIQ